MAWPKSSNPRSQSKDSAMLAPAVQSFVQKAEDRLAGLRGSLLLFAQGDLSAPEIVAAAGRLAEFQFDAESAGFANIGRLAAEAAYSIEQVSRLRPAERSHGSNVALDLLST